MSSFFEEGPSPAQLRLLTVPLLASLSLPSFVAASRLPRSLLRPPLQSRLALAGRHKLSNTRASAGVGALRNTMRHPLPCYYQHSHWNRHGCVE
eukprot:3867790-Rhodomonas_salina.1